VIAPELEHLAVDITTLDELPGNPRKGDVDAVARSYAAFGQQKPVVVQRRGQKTVVIDGTTSSRPRGNSGGIRSPSHRSR